MATGVFGQVVAAHEAPLAHTTHELFLARVCSAVARQLIGTGKLLVAAIPVAAEGLLACRGSGQYVSRKWAESWSEPWPCTFISAALPPTVNIQSQ